MISVLAAVFFAAAAPNAESSVMEALSEKPVFSENATAAEMIEEIFSQTEAIPIEYAQ